MNITKFLEGDEREDKDELSEEEKEEEEEEDEYFFPYPRDLRKGNLKMILIQLTHYRGCLESGSPQGAREIPDRPKSLAFRSLFSD